MNPNKKREIMRKYDSTAHFYDDRYSKIQSEKYNLVFKEYSFENKFLFDAGCGTGLFYDYLLKNLESGSEKQHRFLGVDISWNMLKTFSLKLKKKERLVSNQISLVLSDMENLPFRENIFHTFISLTSLQNLPSIINGINESFRVTKNDGDVKFSILKKKIDMNKVLSHIKLHVINLEIIESEGLEDVILTFNLRKKQQ